MHKVLVNCLVKLAQEKSVVRLTDSLDMIIAVDWDVKPQTKFKKRCCQSQVKVCTQNTGYPLSEACPGKIVVRLTDSLDWDVKPLNKKKKKIFTF